MRRSSSFILLVLAAVLLVAVLAGATAKPACAQYVKTFKVRPALASHVHTFGVGGRCQSIGKVPNPNVGAYRRGGG